MLTIVKPTEFCKVIKHPIVQFNLGGYFSKPGVEDVIETAYAIMHNADPASFPAL